MHFGCPSVKCICLVSEDTDIINDGDNAGLGFFGLFSKCLVMQRAVAE